MKKKKWIEACVICAAMACEGQTPFYKAIVSGDGLIELDESFRYRSTTSSNEKLGEASKRTFCVTIMPFVGDVASGRQRRDLVIDGTALSVTTVNGVVVAMSRDGEDVGIAPPKFDLRGDADWIALSLHYHAEALKLLPFIRFFGIDELTGTNQISVVARHVLPSFSRFVCWASGTMRTFDYHDDNARISRIIERKGEVPMPFVGFDDVEKRTAEWPVMFIAEFDKDSGCLTFISSGKGNFSADFFFNGGLKTLRLFDPETHEGLSERRWNEKGELVHERDLKKDPYPDFDLKDVRMFKGGREVGRSEP